MADIWYDVDTALAEVPVNMLPLVDDTDFKTIKDAVAYNAEGMALNWHFVTTLGAYTVTAVTPTSGGSYDWADTGTSGVYTIEIPASGGASINNDTEGFGWFTGVATGVLPWRSPIFGFRPAQVNNSLVLGTDLLNTNADEVGGAAPETASAIADATLDNTIGDGTLTARQALRILVAIAAAKLSGAETTTITIRNVADSQDVIVATVDSNGNRIATVVTP